MKAVALHRAKRLVEVWDIPEDDKEAFTNDIYLEMLEMAASLLKAFEALEKEVLYGNQLLPQRNRAERRKAKKRKTRR